MNDVKYMSPVQWMSDVSYMNGVKYMPDVQYMNSVTGLQNVTPYSSYGRVPQVNAVDDLGEKANSLLDVILGYDQRNRLLDEEGLGWSKDIPFLNIITGTGALLKDKYFDPLHEWSKGEKTLGQATKEIGLNTLIEVSEDLDVFSNIVKSQMESAGGHFGLDTLGDSLGLNGTRVVYNHNTGNTVEDIVLEVLSDPLTIATFGAGAAKSIGSSGAKTAAMTATKEAAEELSEQALKDYGKAVVKTVAKEGQEATFDSILNNVTRRSLQEITEASLKEATPEIIEATIKSKGYKMFTTATKLKGGIESTDKWITRVAWGVTPVGLPFKYAIKPVMEAAIKHIYNGIVTQLKNYDLLKHFTKHQDAYKEALETAILKNNAIGETVFKNNAAFFRALGIDSTEFQKYFYAMLKQSSNTASDKTVYESFIDYLMANNEKFAQLMKLDSEFSNYVSSEAFKELIDTTSQAPIAIHIAEQELATDYHKASMNSMRKYIEAHSDNLEEMYKYIDETVLNYNGKHFGLERLDDFLAEMLNSRTTSKEYRDTIATLLESNGIRLQNAPNIAKVLRSNIKDKNLAIKKILHNTNMDARLMSDVDYKKIMNKINNKIQANTGTALNKVWKEDIATHNVKAYQGVIDSSIKSVKDAVERINNNQEIQRSIDYIQNVVRLQDIPQYKETMQSVYKAIQEQPGLLELDDIKISQKHIDDLDKFLKDTNRIMDKLESKPDTAFDIASWYAELDKTKKTLDQLQTAFTKHGGPYSVEARKRFYNLQKALEVFTSEEVTDSLLNYTDEIIGMVQAQTSHQGMFSILTQHTHLTKNTDLSEVMDLLSYQDSPLRTEIIPNVIDAFERANMPEAAADVRKVIAQIDTVRNLNEMLSAEIPTVGYRLSNKTQEDLKTILFDIIENNKNTTIADLYSKPVVSYSGWEKSGLSYAEYIADEHLTQYQNLVDTLNKRIEKTQTIRDRVAKDIAGLDVNLDDAIKEIQEQMHKLLDDYINAQGRITGVDNIALSTLYSLDTVSTIEFISNLRYTLARNTDINIELLNDYDTLSRDFLKFAEGIQMGIDEIQKQNAKMAVPVMNYEVTKELRKVCESYNLFSGSVESTMYAAKYVVPKEIEVQFNLLPIDIVGSNEEYTMLMNHLQFNRDLLHEAYKYEDDYINKIRKTLIDTYSQPNALFAPKHPGAYFNTLGKEEVLAWETVTKGSLSMNNKTTFYNFLRSNEQSAMFAKYTKSDFAGQMAAALRNKGFTDDEIVGRLAAQSIGMRATEYANRVIDSNLMYTLHSLDDLGKYKDDLVKYISDDVAAMDDITKRIVSIENESMIYDTYENFGNPDDLAKLGGADYGYSEAVNANLHQMYADRKATQALSIAQMDAEELATHIYRQTPGALVFHNTNIVKTLNPDGSVVYKPLDTVFNFTKEELDNAGLKIMKEVTDDGDWYYIRLTDNRVHNKIPTYAKLPDTHIRVQQSYSKLIDDYRVYLNMWENDDIPANILTVESLNEDTWNKFMDAHADFFGDIEERKLYQKLTPTGSSNFFDKSYSRLNFTVVGGYDTYNTWNLLNSTDFIPRSTQMSKNTYAGLTSAVNRSNKINKYLTMFFNDDYALDNPLIKTWFSEANNKEIKQFFAEGKYRVAILRADKDNLPKVFEYNVTGRRSLDKAIAEGGILVPRETYNAMREVVNSRKMTNSLLDVFRRVVPSTYKSMYLFTAGFPFRNGLDTLFYKNLNEMGGLTAIPKNFKFMYAASEAMELHNEIQEKVLMKTGGETFNKRVLFDVLAEYDDATIEKYFLTDLFINSPASGSLSESLSAWLENYNKIHGEDIRSLWEKVYEDDILFAKTKTYPWTPEVKAHPLNPLARMRDLNDHIEQTGRLALFLESVDSGMPFGDAIDRVVKTHFDYNGGSDLMKICERIFWFSTFPINNLNYYVNGGLTKSPTLMKLLMDTQVASWNNGEYTYEELKKTNFLAYHALRGNLRVGNWIVKTSPSVFDFVNLVTDIPGNIKDRLNPFISVAVGNTDNVGEELNPFITQWRNFQKMRDGNPVPSILSKINEYDWGRTMFRWRNRNYSQGTWTKYPKIKRPTAQIRYVRKYYSRRYNTNVRRLNRTSLYRDAVNYYKIYRRGVTYRDL